MIEYTKWISENLSMLRDRGRVAEKVIHDLKKTGEDSVDQLMEKLNVHKHQQESLDREVESLRSVIEQKEEEISFKEEQINNLKRLIEHETNDKEIEIRRIKTEIEE